MSAGSPREVAGRRLRVSMVAASIYDGAFAVVNLAVPEWGARVLGIPLPEETVYLRFTGVFLILLALFYLLPAIHPGRYLGNVVVAIVGRTAGAIFLLAAGLLFGHPRAFLLLGLGDLAFAALHLFFLKASEPGNPLRHYFE